VLAQGFTVKTGDDASIVLVFRRRRRRGSARTPELAIEEFVQQPFPDEELALENSRRTDMSSDKTAAPITANIPATSSRCTPARSTRCTRSGRGGDSRTTFRHVYRVAPTRRGFSSGPTRAKVGLHATMGRRRRSAPGLKSPDGPAAAPRILFNSHEIRGARSGDRPSRQNHRDARAACVSAGPTCGRPDASRAATRPGGVCANETTTSRPIDREEQDAIKQEQEKAARAESTERKKPRRRPRRRRRSDFLRWGRGASPRINGQARAVRAPRPKQAPITRRID